jgi:hypothetical protein
MFCAMLSSSHQRVNAATSAGEEGTGRVGIRTVKRSRRAGMSGSEGSKIWPRRPFARIKEVTASSQAKKSNLFVRVGICATEGRVLDICVVRGKEEGGTG